MFYQSTPHHLTSFSSGFQICLKSWHHYEPFRYWHISVPTFYKVKMTVIANKWYQIEICNGSRYCMAMM